jgi:hypothetical protein
MAENQYMERGVEVFFTSSEVKDLQIKGSKEVRTFLLNKE